MEHPKKINREKVQLLMVIGIYLSIILLLIAIIVIVKNVNEIKTDPISYGMEKNNFKLCNCYNEEGRIYYYNTTGIIPDQDGGCNIRLQD